MKSFIPLLCAMLLLASCCNTKKAVYKENEFQIFFGNSGGFTNATMEYVINGDRNIFKIEKDSTFFVKKVTNEDMKELKKMISDSDFGKLELSNPGNLTYFIEVKSDEYKNRVNWSDSDNEQVISLYKYLLTTLKFGE